jgi:phosphate-selective porin OprO/OprP
MSLRMTFRSRSPVVPPVCLAAALIALFDVTPVRSQPGPTDEGPPLRVHVAQSSEPENVEPARKNRWFRWEDHPELRFGEARVALRARVQADRRRSDVPTDDEDDGSWDVARRRIGVEGRYGRYVEFQVERELADAFDPWRDVFANYRQFDHVQFQYGKFKLPFSLDENTSATNLDFVRRSLAANLLAPGRDRGWMVHGRVLARTLRYEFGMFEHDGRNARTRRDDRVYGGTTQAFRIGAQPFRASTSPARDLHVGVAWTWSDVPEGSSGLRGQTAFGQTFFSSNYLVLGQRERFGVEMRWRAGPASLASEYIKVTDERLGQSVEDTDLSPLRAVGWYVSGTWALTGDNKADGLDSPKHPLFQGGVGAIELAARLERLTFGSTATGEPSASYRADAILGNSNRAVTIGANWYPNRWLKIQFNLIREGLVDPGQGPLPSRTTFWSRVMRFQVQL